MSKRFCIMPKNKTFSKFLTAWFVALTLVSIHSPCAAGAQQQPTEPRGIFASALDYLKLALASLGWKSPLSNVQQQFVEKPETTVDKSPGFQPIVVEVSGLEQTVLDPVTEEEAQKQATSESPDLPDSPTPKPIEEVVRRSIPAQPAQPTETYKPNPLQPAPQQPTASPTPQIGTGVGAFTPIERKNKPPR